MTEKRMTPAQAEAVRQVTGDLAISAGAGSGKTTVLAHRFAHGLCADPGGDRSPAQVDQVLTITFTKKAAGEIAERVRRVVNQQVSVVTGRKIADGWISTFHTFCGRLVRRHLLEADIEPGFLQIDEVGSAALGKDAFEACCAPLYQSDASVRRLVDGWGATRLSEDIVGAYENIRSMGLNPSEVEVPNDLDGLAVFIHAASVAANAHLADLEVGKQTPTIQKRASELRSWCAAVHACSSGDDLCARLLELDESGHTTGLARTDTRLAYVDARKRLSAALAAAGDPDLTSALERLLRAYAEQYAAIKAQRNALDFDDLQERAVSLLTDHPDVAEQYRSKFRMIMVDEFQDTNDLQMRVLAPLRNENLCIVGDERQSIYGFRHADVRVFERVRAELGNSIELDDNFRSHPQIMTVVNETFSMAHLFGAGFMRLGSGRVGGWKLQLPEENPRVECVLIAQDDCSIEVGREVEADHIAARIAELLEHQGLLGKDIAILLRAASQAPVYARALERRGIPVLVSAGLRLFDARETGEVLSLLRAIAVPADDEALLQVLGGRMVALGDDGLLAIRAETPRHRPLWEGLRVVAESGADALMPAADRDAARHAYHVIDSFGRDQGRFGIADLLHRACEEFDFDLTLFAQGPEGVRAWANVLKIARVADQFEASGSGDLAAFVDYLRDRQESAKDKAAAADAGDDAIRIMTVHSAKGLEFPVVFVADLARGKKHKTGSLLVGRAQRDGREVPIVGMNPPSDAFGGMTTPAHLLMDPDVVEASLEEEKRCLYVAATRAEELLVLSGAAKMGKPAAGGSTLIDWVREALGDPDASGVIPLGAASVSVSVIEPEEAAAPDQQPEPEACAPVFATPRSAARSYGGRAARPTEVSYSSLQLHERCALSYQTKHALRLGRFDDPAEQSPTGLGSAVHAVLESVTEARPTSELVATAAHRFRLDGEQKVRLERAVEAFMASEVAGRLHGGDRLRREEPFRVRLGETVLLGNIDAIAWHGANAFVVDYKTGKGPQQVDPQRRAAYELQAKCYALAAFESGAEEAEVVFCFVEHDAVTITFGYAADRDHAVIREELIGRIQRIEEGECNHLPHYDANTCSSCPALGGICPIDPPPRKNE